MSILMTFIVIGIIAAAHELGHFFAARRQGIAVRELSIGVGPKIVQRKLDDTRFSLRLIPVFAYVHLAGSLPEEQDIPGGFLKAPPKTKAKVLAAGSAMNILLAVVIFIVLFMGIGVYSDAPRIGAVYPDSPAYEAGLKKGDTILSIGGETIGSWMDMTDAIAESGGQTLRVQVERGGQELGISVVPAYSEEAGRALIGIERTRERLGPIQAVYEGVVQSFLFVTLMVQALVMMATGSIPADVSGPVGIASMVGQATAAGITSLLYFTAVLSLNLAIINLLPIPGLDGGKLVLVLVEKVRGKRLPYEKEAMINIIGFAVLIAVMLLATYRDIARLFSP